MTRSEDQLDALLEGASPRPEPPAAVRARVLAAVEREWRQHKRRRWRLPAALAAVLLVAVVAGLMLRAPAQDVELRITDTTGVWVEGVHHPRGGTDLVLRRGVAIHALSPTRLATPDDVEIRLRDDSRVTWLEPHAVALERGSIYVDTRGRGHLQVRTPLGVVTDVGTRFMVTLRDGGMEVALREGTTHIDTEHGSYTAQAGDRQGDVVLVTRERVVAEAQPASAARWQWIHGAHPGYVRREIAGLLRDITRDLGVALEFDSPAVEAAALQGKLEGDISGLGPEQALEVVLATSGLHGHRPSADQLVIGFQSAID